MKALSASQRETLTTLANVYYEVVPLKLRTYCSLTAQISEVVLQRFGIEAAAVPCQLWCSTSDHEYEIGFVGNQPKEGKWDGHAICVAGDWFIDTALSHLQAEFGINVPPVAFAPRFTVPTQVIGRIDCGEQKCLSWYHPPSGVDTRMPEEPAALVYEYSSQLIARLETIQRPSDGNPRRTGATPGDHRLRLTAQISDELCEVRRLPVKPCGCRR